MSDGTELRHEVVAGEEGRADRIVRPMTGRSWSESRGLFARGCVQVNGEACGDPGAEVAAGDVVTVRQNPGQRYREPPRERANSAFRIVFEDDDLIVVDKTAHLLTVPTSRNERNTLLGGVTQHVLRRGRGRACVVHRLDRGTSGLLVFAKSPGIAKGLQEQFRVRKSEREYIAIVAGKVEPNTGTFRSRLGTTKSLQRVTVDEDEAGEDAVTHYTVVQPLKGGTLVRARLETGRRNQIRVHFAEAGHPVLGDERYRTELARHREWKARRLALHAATLGFEHPRTGEGLRFESPLPGEFERFVTATQLREAKGETHLSGD